MVGGVDRLSEQGMHLPYPSLRNRNNSSDRSREEQAGENDAATVRERAAASFRCYTAMTDSMWNGTAADKSEPFMSAKQLSL